MQRSSFSVDDNTNLPTGIEDSTLLSGSKQAASRRCHKCNLVVAITVAISIVSGLAVSKYFLFMFKESVASAGLDGVQFKLMSFNVLGQGFAGLPGNDEQTFYFHDFARGDLQTMMRPAQGGISIVGFQEDVCVLKPGMKWMDTTDDRTHERFEPLSFLDVTMRSNGWQRGSVAVHDGNPNTGISNKNLEAKFLLTAAHQAYFGKEKVQKLCNTIYYKLDANFASQVSVEGYRYTFNFGEWSKKAGLPVGLPSRSAASIRILNKKTSQVLFVATTTHLSGGKFDDEELLTQDGLSETTSANYHQLQFFGAEMSKGVDASVPRVLFGDCNMKLHKFMAAHAYAENYDGALRDYYWQVSPWSVQGKEERSAVVGLGFAAAFRKGVESKGYSGRQLEVYTQAESVDYTAVDYRTTLLYQRGKILWTLPNEVAGMMPLDDYRRADSSAYFGGVIDHVFHSNIAIGHHALVKEFKMYTEGKTEVKQQIMDPNLCDPRQKPPPGMWASDHFPIYVEFQVASPPVKSYKLMKLFSSRFARRWSK